MLISCCKLQYYYYIVCVIFWVILEVCLTTVTKFSVWCWKAFWVLKPNALNCTRTSYLKRPFQNASPNVSCVQNVVFGSSFQKRTFLKSSSSLQKVCRMHTKVLTSQLTQDPRLKIVELSSFLELLKPFLPNASKSDSILAVFFKWFILGFLFLLWSISHVPHLLPLSLILPFGTPSSLLRSKAFFG